MLPAPNLDDRRFQDLVDDAKRFVQQRCPEWSDHNVSDPGVTLIEVFAQMTDQLVYRLNRVPDRNYVKFLELIGLRRFPPVAARVPVTFWLSSIPKEVHRIARSTTVATPRTETEAALEFSTVEDLDVIPVSALSIRSSSDGDRTRSNDDDVLRGQGFTCFAAVPVVGNALYVGLSEAAPSNIVVLGIRCSIDGIGVDPDRPPLRWEAWTGDAWAPCDLERDTTGGLNRNGEVVLHVPKGHVPSLLANQRAGWLRAVVTEALDGQPVYSSSPIITEIRAHTIGGTADSVHARLVEEEVVGTSDGSPGQRFTLASRSVVRFDGSFLEVGGDDGWTTWTDVAHFADSRADSLHYVLDGVDGEVLLGPAVRMEDGSLRAYGCVPPRGAVLRLRRFAVGGGVAGNVNKGAVTVLKSSVPHIARVENRRAAVGGRDAETVDNAKLRGPLMLRSRGRAVTVEDFEELAREAAPEVARVRCVPAGQDGVDAGSVRILVVPDVPMETGRIRFEQLVPPEDAMARIARELDGKRLVGTRVSVEPPVYQGVTIVARIRARGDHSPVRLQEQALTALHRYFNAIEGGPHGNGWPFGRPLLLGEVYAVLQRVPGVELVEDARMFGADPITGQRGQAAQRIDISSNALVFSYEHQVLVEGQA